MSECDLSTVQYRLGVIRAMTLHMIILANLAGQRRKIAGAGRAI